MPVETFALLNSFTAGGHVVSIKDPETFKAQGITHLGVKPVLAVEPESEEGYAKRVFTSITMPKGFMRTYDEAFTEKGNVLIHGAMDTFTWERDDEIRMGINCSLWAEAQNSDGPVPIRTTNLLTLEDPVYRNEVSIAGIAATDPVTGEQSIEVEGGHIVVLHNKKTEKRNVFAPVFVKEIPEEFGDDADAVWVAIGPLEGKKLPRPDDADEDDRPSYRDCVVAETFVRVGTLDKVVSCTQDSGVPF